MRFVWIYHIPRRAVQEVFMEEPFEKRSVDDAREDDNEEHGMILGLKVFRTTRSAISISSIFDPSGKKFLSLVRVVLQDKPQKGRSSFAGSS